MLEVTLSEQYQFSFSQKASYRQGLPVSRLQGCNLNTPSLASGFRQSLPERRDSVSIAHWLKILANQDMNCTNGFVVNKMKY
jgi:hypothetical protein